MMKNNLVALFHALSGASCLVLSLIAKDQVRISEQPIKTIGFILFALGGAFFAYSVLYLRAAFQGNVEPVTDNLVSEGPYRWMRHPLYFSMLLMCYGLSVGLRSILGFVLTSILFFPLSVYRARLEEAALEAKFGVEWQEYSSRTDFLIPFLF